MKSFEVKLGVTGKAKDETKTVFVQAENKAELEKIDGVLKVWERNDIKPSDCPMHIVYEAITNKD